MTAEFAIAIRSRRDRPLRYLLLAVKTKALGVSLG